MKKKTSKAAAPVNKEAPAEENKVLQDLAVSAGKLTAAVEAMHAELKKTSEAPLPAANVFEAFERRIEMRFVDFIDGISAGGMTLNYFDRASPEGGCKECWLVGEEFVCIAQDGQQAVVPKDQARVWVPIHAVKNSVGNEVSVEALDWMGEEVKMPPEMRNKVFLMKK